MTDHRNTGSLDQVGRADSVKADGSIIPDRVIEVLHGPAVMVVGTRDAGLRPSHVCVVGAVVHDDRRTVTFFVPESRSPRLLSDLQHNRRVAFSFGWASHEAYQLKGTYRSSHPTTPDDVGLQEAYRAKLFAAFQKVYPEDLARAFALGVAYQPGVAVTFRVEEVFQQTPGPGAGTRMA